MKLDPSAGSLKTESSERAVPLHPAIIEAGFLQFVKTVRKGAILADLAPIASAIVGAQSQR